MASSRKPSMASTYVTEKRISQWEELMRKFSEAHKEQFKANAMDIPRVERSAKHFPTGSQYEGSWDVLGMSGYGVYTFPNGVIYEGDFEDGMFHGKGQLRYASGLVVRGKFVNGVLTERTLLSDNMEYSENNWKYCMMPDRRFEMEYVTGLKPAGQSNLTADQPTREIPPGYYDTGDGFYDPKTKVIYKYEDMSAILRSPTTLEQQWIVKNCRVNPAKPLGPCPDLYVEYTEPVLKPEPTPPPAAGVKCVMASFRTQSMYEDFEIYTEPPTLYEDSEELLTINENGFENSSICVKLNGADIQPETSFINKESEAAELTDYQPEALMIVCSTIMSKKRLSTGTTATEMPISPRKTYATGCTYDGTYDAIGMSGYGEYTFPNGVLYRGQFVDGMFHGNGELVYNEDGTESVIRGVWVKGELTERKVYFNGSLEYADHKWKYCDFPDRRYGVEYEMDLMPGGQSHLTADDPPREIPPGLYDSGDGFYNPVAKNVCDYERPFDVIRAPSRREQKWLQDNCRKEPLGTVGPRQDQYESWSVPVPDPPPLPNPVVSFKKKSATLSSFKLFQESVPAFYEPSSDVGLLSVPLRKFQSAALKF